MTQRVIVTGATGFVGRHVLPVLKEAGFDVHTLGRGMPDSKNVTAHAVDLLDLAAVERCIASLGASHLLHLAWYAEPGLYWTSPINLSWVGASLALLRFFAETGGTRAVLAGTCAEYRWGGETVFDETASAIAPATIYGVSKDAVRRVSLAYAEGSKLSVAWGRLFYLYGPHEKPGRLVSDAIGCLLAKQPFRTTEGTQRRDFMHVEDVAGALSALLVSDVRGCVNVASGQAGALRDLLALIAEETQGQDYMRFGERPMAAHDPKLVGASIGRLRDEVGFAPRHTLKSGLVETVRWWKSQ